MRFHNGPPNGLGASSDSNSHYLASASFELDSALQSFSDGVCWNSNAIKCPKTI